MLVKASHNASSNSRAGKQMGRGTKSYCKRHRSMKARTIVVILLSPAAKAKYKPNSDKLQSPYRYAKLPPMQIQVSYL